MTFKFLIFLAVVAVANCGFIGAPYPYYAAPTLIKTIAPAPTVIKKIEIEPPAQYNFKYGVNDATTGDIKNQEETRNGDAVTGSYSLIDADGLKRTVDYTATPEGGFNAVVRREGIPIAPAPIIKKIIAPAPAYYQPAFTKIIAAPAPATTVTKVIAGPAHAYTKLIAPIRPGGFSYSISSPSYLNNLNYGW